jgi:multidrug efflux pump subunit AcrA (membrane-fusion protein)
MNFLRRIRPGLIVLGVALAVGSLVGARALTAGSGNQNGKPDGEPKTANPLAVRASGPIVLGTVDSDPPPVWYGLPPVVQTGTVSGVFVKDGMQVKVGDRLYEFDTELQKTHLEKAQMAVATAKAKVHSAQEAVKTHTKQVELAKQDVLFAQEKETLQGKNYNLIRSNLEQFWKNQKKPSEQPYTDTEIAKKLEDDPQLAKAHADYVRA